jgi:hypothetical protein
MDRLKGRGTNTRLTQAFLVLRFTQHVMVQIRQSHVKLKLVFLYPVVVHHGFYSSTVFRTGAGLAQAV